MVLKKHVSLTVHNCNYDISCLHLTMCWVLSSEVLKRFCCPTLQVTWNPPAAKPPGSHSWGRVRTWKNMQSVSAGAGSTRPTSAGRTSCSFLIQATRWRKAKVTNSLRRIFLWGFFAVAVFQALLNLASWKRFCTLAFENLLTSGIPLSVLSQDVTCESNSNRPQWDLEHSQWNMCRDVVSFFQPQDYKVRKVGSLWTLLRPAKSSDLRTA